MQTFRDLEDYYRNVEPAPDTPLSFAEPGMVLLLVALVLLLLA